MNDKTKNKVEKRKSKYTLWLSQTELDELKNRCDQNTLSGWIRTQLLSKNSKNREKTVVKKADPKLLNTLGRIGSNLNQLTRLANTNKLLDQQILNEITAIRKCMYQLIEKEINKASNDNAD